MKPELVLIPFLVVIVFLLIRAELLKKQPQIYIFKPIATLLVIVVALLAFIEPSHNKVYAFGVLAGLLLSFGGDIALMFSENRKAFTVGLGLFLLAHIANIVVFQMLGQISA